MTKDTHEADVAFIRALAELLRECELTELQVKRDYAEDDSLNVRVSRHVAAMPPAPPAPPAPPVPPRSDDGGPAMPTTTPPAPGEAARDPYDDPAHHPGAVTSPMVGTAYLSPEPGADPFVKLGDSVEEGQTLVIVEAMKTMNQIPAPRAGTVQRILVADGSPVEFGAPLMIVE